VLAGRVQGRVCDPPLHVLLLEHRGTDGVPQAGCSAELAAGGGQALHIRPCRRTFAQYVSRERRVNLRLERQ